MAAIVTSKQLDVRKLNGVICEGPNLVATLSETDVSTPDTSLIFTTKGVSMMAFQPIFANYTSVTVKAQRSLDGTNWSDISSATTSTSGAVISFDPQAPLVRLSIAGTLSGGADTMTIWAYQEHMR